MSFPTYSSSQQKGREGEARFNDFVTNTLKCIYHKIDGSNDFGIDGHIELVKNGLVMGKFVAVQIKHGDSYLSRKTENGHKFIATDKSLNYYLNSPVPVFLVIMNGDFSIMNWVRFDIEKIFPAGEDSWFIEIPEHNSLTTNFKDELFASVGPIYDYASLMKDIIKRNKALNNMFDNFDNVIIGVSKDEVNSLDFSGVVTVFNCFSNNKVFRHKFKSSCSLFFPGYSDDPRELWEIPEVTRWIKESLNKNIPWFYFMSYEKGSILPLFIRSCIAPFNSTRMSKGTYVEYDAKEIVKFLEIAFANLNSYSEKYNISNEINVEISKKLGEFIYGRGFDHS